MLIQKWTNILLRLLIVNAISISTVSACDNWEQCAQTPACIQQSQEINRTYPGEIIFRCAVHALGSDENHCYSCTFGVPEHWGSNICKVPCS